MLGWLTGQGDARRTAVDLYGRVVAAARQPQLYREFGVPDSTEGRFEMIALHLFLALEALRRPHDGPEAGEDAASRMTIEAFVTDMDDCMREMGVGDLTVPKKVKRAAAGFYERSGDYRAALEDRGVEPLTAALARHVWKGDETAGDAARLAVYARAVAATLAGKDVRDSLSAGDCARAIDAATRRQ